MGHARPGRRDNPARKVDVLVAGTGAAGASAAIAAHDAGASVVVVEKTPAGGGNCVHSEGFLFQIDGPAAIDHLDALCFGKTDLAVLAASAGGPSGVAGFLASLGGATAPVDRAGFAACCRPGRTSRVRGGCGIGSSCLRQVSVLARSFGESSNRRSGRAIVFGRIAGAAAACITSAIRT